MFLDLRAFHEGVGKLVRYITFVQQLTIVVSPELQTLIRIAPWLHLKLQILLIDTLTYKPTFLVRASKEAHKILGIEEGEHILCNLVKDISRTDKALH